MQNQSRLAQYLAVAQVLKPQGIAGELKLKPLTDDDERFFELKAVYLLVDGQYQKRTFHAVRVHNGFVYARLAGVTDRNVAETMRDVILYVDREHAAKLPRGRYFIVDLIGCTIYTKDGEEVGILRDIIQTGANDVYVIENGKKQWMLPALKSVLLDVNVEQGRIRVDESALLEVDQGAY
ncbi:MAG: 16S rRNA processing protein RimM [Clostridia bacterium]|nr:16S rRNA processing protein RimM [Clostridia bacterium]